MAYQPTTARPYIFYVSAATASTNFSAAQITLVSASAHGALPTHYVEVKSLNLHSALGFAGAYCTTAGVVVARVTNPSATTISSQTPTLEFLAR